METRKKTKRTFLFHPILLGLYPVLALYAFNRNETVTSAIQLALLTSLLVTLIVLALFLLIFRSWQRAAAPASFALLLLYSYGHVYDLAQNIRLFGQVIGRDRFLVPVWILLFLVGIILLSKSRRPVLNTTLNTVSLFLVAFVIVQIALPIVQFANTKASASEEPPLASDSPVDSVQRDVYYILVDAYSRQDLLQEKLDLDISSFISELQNLGFYIPACAQSNYDTTLNSLTTTLNMNYLEAIGLTYLDDKAKYEPHIQQNPVMERFKDLGYRLATFKSLYRMLDLPNSTYYYDYFEDASSLNSPASINFQYLFLKTTFLRPLVAFLERNQDITVPSYLAAWLPIGNTRDSREYRQYQQSVFALDSLKKTPDLPGKKFVYAHLYITHQPYVFNTDGSFHPSLPQEEDAYVDQVIYANTALLEIVRAILAKSDPEPIIVLQSDHSYFEGADRVKILNAYYFPDGKSNALYKTITPVNTFRVIFNAYFGSDYHLLPDISMYADENQTLQEAPSTCIAETSSAK